MNRKKLAYKAASLAMAACMTVGMTSALTGCGSKKNETITLEVYSQLANYSGLQTGWIADIFVFDQSECLSCKSTDRQKHTCRTN